MAKAVNHVLHRTDSIVICIVYGTSEKENSTAEIDLGRAQKRRRTNGSFMTCIPKATVT